MHLRAFFARCTRPALALGVLATVSISVALPVSFAGAVQKHALSRAGGVGKAPVPSTYNARFDVEAQAEFAKAGRGGKRSELSRRELAAEKALAQTVSGLHLERDEVSKLPVLVLSYEPGAPLMAPSNKTRSSPEAAAREYLRANKQLYNLTDNDLSSLAVRYVTSPEGGATVVKFDQYVNGLQLFDTELAVTLSKENAVFGAGGRVYPGVAQAARTHAAFVLDAPEATVRALGDLTGTVAHVTDFAVVNTAAGGGYQTFEYTPDRTSAGGKLLSRHVRTKRYLYPLGAGQFEPAHYVELWVTGDAAGPGPVFSYVISAADGRLLFRNNLTAHVGFTYRVYADNFAPYRPWDGPTGPGGTPHPAGTPNGFQAPFVTQNDVFIESLLGPSDPWLPAGATVTTGNNVEAYLDLDAQPGGVNDGFTAGDLRGMANGPNQFLYTHNPNISATDATNRQAAVVGMFYQVNWMHDVWYQHGFTEAAGNAQMDNYGRGGVPLDSVMAEGQDNARTDNAFMTTPADGARPRLETGRFLADGRLNPDRDGALEMLVVGHELTHYLSNRLVGNSAGLGNSQGKALGEGWSDFSALLLTSQNTDNVDGVYAPGGYTDLYWCGESFVDNYYFSIRRYPYSTRKDRNPLTFKDIGPGISAYPGVPSTPCFNVTADPAELHNSGEVWANVLWEGFAGLAKAYGVPTARNKMTQYMIDGLKLTPSFPTFTQARDAVIVAASAANPYANAKDTQILWQAFAKRGMGTNAVSPASDSNDHAGVVEDFTAAPALPDDTIGVVIGNTFYEQNTHFGGTANSFVSFGSPALTPIVGNWDGGTEVGAASEDHPGMYDPSTGAFFLRNSNSPGSADLVFTFGAAGAGWMPVVGDWNGDSAVTVGVYDPATGTFFLRNANSPGAADTAFAFGPAGGGWLPIAGDWNGDGVDTIGIYSPAAGVFFLKDTNSPGPADYAFAYGPATGEWRPVVGDWNSDGVDTIGIYSQATGVFFLRNTNGPGPADETFTFGPANLNARPIYGNFDGQ